MNTAPIGIRVLLGFLLVPLAPTVVAATFFPSAGSTGESFVPAAVFIYPLFTVYFGLTYIILVRMKRLNPGWISIASAASGAVFGIHALIWLAWELTGGRYVHWELLFDRILVVPNILIAAFAGAVIGVALGILFWLIALARLPRSPL